MDVKPALSITGEDGNEAYLINKAVRTLRASGAKESYIGQFLQDISNTYNYEELISKLFEYFDLEEDNNVSL